MAPYCFIIWRICMYCFMTWFTSCTDVPLPVAIRFRRLPSITLWSRRFLVGHRVDDRLHALQTCSRPPFASLGKFATPDFRQHVTTCSSGPILRTLLQLIPEILQRELVSSAASVQLHRGLFVNGLLWPARSAT